MAKDTKETRTQRPNAPGKRIVEPRSVTSAGAIQEYGMRNIWPTLLDYLFDNGLLGIGESAHSRYRAGLELRELYYSFNKSTSTGCYDMLDNIPDTGDISEQRANAEAHWNSLMRELGTHARLLRAVCVEDIMPREPREVRLT